MPRADDSQCCPGDLSGLEDGQGAREALDGGATSTGGYAGAQVVGIDELSIRKGYMYRIVVSDLIRERPIWFGGMDHLEASMDLFLEWLGTKKIRKIRLAVMDMWKPFHNAYAAHAPGAAMLYDKFHALRHLGDSLEKRYTAAITSD